MTTMTNDSYFVIETVNIHDHIFSYLFINPEIGTFMSDLANYEPTVCGLVPQSEISSFFMTLSRFHDRVSDFGPRYYKVDNEEELKKVIKENF